MVTNHFVSSNTDDNITDIFGIVAYHSIRRVPCAVFYNEHRSFSFPRFELSFLSVELRHLSTMADMFASDDLLNNPVITIESLYDRF